MPTVLVEAAGEQASVDYTLTPALPAPLRIDPRAYLTTGQTWAGSDIRSALRSAYLAACAHTVSDPLATAIIELPPALGRVTSTTPAAQLPVNRRSSASPKNRIVSQAGIGLRCNVAGTIVFEGDRSLSGLGLSDNARGLFFIDTDISASGTAFVWESTGRYFAAGGSRFLGERPTKPIIFRNHIFRDFYIDNAFTIGSQVLIGNMPSRGVEQPYVSVQNVHVTRVDCKNFIVADSVDDMATNHKAFVSFLAKHNSSHEAKQGGQPTGGFASPTSTVLIDTPNGIDSNSADYWLDFNLETVAGRTAAYAAGFTWMVNCTVTDCHADGPSRGVLFVGHREDGMSVYMDRLYARDVTHDTLAGFRTYEPYIGSTAIYLGGDCIGGHAGVYNSRSIAIGDDSIEAGGFTHFEVDGFYAENAVLDGILYVHSQKPIDALNSTLTIRNYHSRITGNALKGTITGSGLDHIRGVPLETTLENENTALESSAVPYPVAITVEDSIFEVDGIHYVNGVKTYGDYERLSRAGRLGFAFNYPARNLTLRNCVAKYSGMRLNGTSGVTNVAMFYALPRIPATATGKANLLIENAKCVFSDVQTAGAKVNLIGIMPACNGTARVLGVDLRIENSPAVASYHIVRVGDRINTTLSMPPSGGTVEVDGATVTVVGTTITGAKVGVKRETDYTLASLVTRNINAPTPTA